MIAAGHFNLLFLDWGEGYAFLADLLTFCWSRSQPFSVSKMTPTLANIGCRPPRYAFYIIATVTKLQSPVTVRNRPR